MSTLDGVTAAAPAVSPKRAAADWGGLGKFLFFRVAMLVATLLASSIVIFGALYAAPGSPLTFLTHGRSMTPGAIAQLKHQYHLDQSVPAQYWDWLSGMLHGDFGTSIVYRTSVSSLIGPRFATTALLVLLSTILITIVGLALGIFTGLKPGLLSESLMALATGAMAVPAFVAAVILTSIFAVNLGWFPVFGSGSGFMDRLDHLALPSIALAFASIAFVARLTRAAVKEELQADHVQTAISRGLPYAAIVRRHVVRNAAVPVLTVAGLTIAGLIAGSVVVEQLFQLNGLGSFLVSAVQQKDFPVVQAICMTYVASFIILNMLIDIAYSILDPRISLGGER